IVLELSLGALDQDRLVLVAGFLEQRLGLIEIVGQRRAIGIEAKGVTLGDRAVGNDALSPPEALDDGVAIDRERERLLDFRIVERRNFGVDGQNIEAGIEGAFDACLPAAI